MANTPEPRKWRPLFRVLAGFMCPIFLVLALLVYPHGFEHEVWRLSAPLGGVLGAIYCGKVARTGRAPRW